MASEKEAGESVLLILQILKILEKTDEFHPINSGQINKQLEQMGYPTVNRKTIGNYIKALRDKMQYDIEVCENRNLGYYMVKDGFEDYELKMLTDAVAEAQFISIEDSRAMIKKIANLATTEGERIIGSMKQMDASLKLVDNKFRIKFDKVMRAIADKKKIKFQYMEIGKGNKKLPVEEGKIFVVSPYYLGVWGHEYYFVGCEDGSHNVSSYRVEMAERLEVTQDSIISMREIEELKNVGKSGRSFVDFIKEYINLQNGDVKEFTISGVNSLRKSVMKKFGNTINFHDLGEDRFTVIIKANDSRGFYEWISQFGNQMKIVKPAECVEKHKQFLLEALNEYK